MKAAIEGGERGNTMENPADGGCEGLGAGPEARRRYVRKLPRTVLNNRVCSRGRDVRFILHAEGRVANCTIYRTGGTAIGTYARPLPERNGICRRKSRRVKP
jgi:hypothetical protein